MFGTMRRTHFLDLFCSHPDDEAAAFGFTFGLEHAGSLFLLSISRPPIIGPTFQVWCGYTAPRRAAALLRRGQAPVRSPVAARRQCRLPRPDTHGEGLHPIHRPL